MAFIRVPASLPKPHPSPGPCKTSRASFFSTPRRRKPLRLTATVSSPAPADNPSDAPATSSSSRPDPAEAFSKNLKASIESTFDALLSPLLQSCSVLQRRWTLVGGNYILRPPPSKPPRAVLHFLGGAFFAAAPHILYRTFLERLCARGYVVVATPFEIGFDHLAIAAGIADKWERVETDLALDYGALPVIGLGHSAGCVFHALASSLFDDVAPKAANVLISFSNRKAEEAIPMYKQVIIPAAAGAVGLNDSLPADVRNTLRDLPLTFDAAVEDNYFTPRRMRENVLPAVKESRRVVEQIWPLLQETVGRGPRVDAAFSSEAAAEQATKAASASQAREFYPSPEEVEKSVSGLYAVESTLVVQFRDDSLDDSDALAAALRARGEPANVSVVTMEGSHLTPLAQDLPDFAGAQIPGPLGLITGQGPGPNLIGMIGAAMQEGMNAFGLRDLTALETIVDEWVTKGIEEDRF